MIAVVFLLLGLLMILLEFYIPGAIFGIIGGTFVLCAVILFAYLSHSLLAALLFFLASLIAVLGVIRFALWRIPRTQPERSIYSNSAQDGYIASTFDKGAIGKKGRVVSDLKPGGYIVVEGKTHQALSVSGYIPKGEMVDIIGGEGESLVVQQVKKD
jgi:membrane-bound ClpP family serine protease